MKKITLLILLLNIFLLKGCENDTSSSNGNLSDDLTIESFFSSDDLTISLSNDSLPSVGNDDILTYEEAALIGSRMVFDLLELDLENKHIVMHYIPIESVWRTPYEYDEWVGFIWEKDNYSLYFSDRFAFGINPQMDELAVLIEFRVNATSGIVTSISRPNQTLYAIVQSNNITQYLMGYEVDESLNPSPAKVKLAQERAEHYFFIFAGDIELQLLYNPADPFSPANPFNIIPIPLFQFIFTCADGKYHVINLHYETHQLLAIFSRNEWPFSDLNRNIDDSINDYYVENNEKMCEYDCVIFGDFIQELDLSLGMPIYQVINLLGVPCDEEYFEFDGVEIGVMSWDNLNSTDLFPYRIRIHFEDGYLTQLIGYFTHRVDWDNYSSEISWGMSSQEAYQILGLPSMILYNKYGIQAVWENYELYSLSTGIQD